MLSRYKRQVTIIGLVVVVVVLSFLLAAMQFPERPSTPVTTTNWRYCTDAKQAYSIQYPSDIFQPVNANGGCTLLLVADNSIPAQQALYVFVLDNPERLSLVHWLGTPSVQASEEIVRRSGDISNTHKTIGSREWIVFDRNNPVLGFPPAGYIYWATLYDDKVVLVGLLNLDINKYGAIIEQILATFQPVHPE